MLFFVVGGRLNESTLKNDGLETFSSVICSSDELLVALAERDSCENK